ncbi:MAG: N-methyl-L-tryptophan oxidase [Armatimonadetes bacterium]|nr:N-methyl-L-tryptophan oxidase [Armatimonadota bacterium]
MSNSYDVIVVGVGAMGAAACRHLARRGVRVLGLEQFGIPHALGSSHGSSRLFRMAYFEHPDYVPLLQRAYALWRELEAESGQTLLPLTGGLYIGPPGSELVSGSLASARRHALPHEALDRAQLAARFPQFHLPDGYEAIYERQAGFVRPELAVAVMAERALRDGAELHGHEPVIAWQEDGNGVTAETAQAVYKAERLVFCGGAWSGRLVRDLGVALTVTRQVMAWVWPRRPDLFAPDRFPTWAIANEDGTLHYGVPLLPDVPGVKIAHHGRGVPTDPDAVAHQALPGDEEDFRPALRRFLPDADGPTLSLRVCLYTNSPDGHFIIDHHPRHPRVTLACGFSGHGFKFAPVIGEALADLAQQGTTTLPIGFLRLGRFATPMGR